MNRLLRRLIPSEENANRLLMTLLLVGFAALLLGGGITFWSQLRTQDHGRLVAHTREVESLIADFAVLHERAETARRGYLVGGEESFKRIYDDTAAKVPRMLDRIRAATRDNPSQQARVEQIARLLAPQQELQRRSMALVRSGARDAALLGFRSDPSVPLMRRIRGLAQQLREREDRLLVDRDAEQRRSLRTFYQVLAGTGLLLLLVAAATWLVIRRYVRDLGASRAVLRSLNEDLEGAVRERTADLQRANEEIQRFAYIVSHDLRSPLVNVMGFTAELDAARKPLAELIDRAEAEAPAIVTETARLAAREDLPEAIGFIRTSTQKMDRLINAILKLSRQGRRTLVPEQVDMDVLVQTVADTLRHRVDELGAEIRIAKPLPAIVSDRLALEQIFSNLVENAVKYLKPGHPGRIEVRGSRERDRIVYEIADNGRGIDPKDHERVFDLFRRSGMQDQPGEGIGLAHVRALVYRLGGIIELKSALDEGATFRLVLPEIVSGKQGDS